MARRDWLVHAANCRGHGRMEEGVGLQSRMEMDISVMITWDAWASASDRGEERCRA